MSDADEKPFAPTPHRIAKARREGNVARSSEFAANVSFAAAGWSVVAMAPLFGTIGGNCFVHVASNGRLAPECALIIAPALLPIGSALVAGTMAGVLQNGGLIFVAVGPKPERLDPMQGLKRVCSRETLAHTGRATLAFACAAAVIVPLIVTAAATMLQAASFVQVVAAAWNAARSISAAAVAVGFVFSIAEYGAARGAWLRKLRMSFEERKREAKEEEGDAFARGRRRSLHRALLRSGVTRVKDAAFIVVNPAHVAVALEYRPPAVPVPRILVRARGEFALRVREIARVLGIPIVEDVALARALYRDGSTGDPIPHVHYVAVAEVVAGLMRALEQKR